MCDELAAHDEPAPPIDARALLLSIAWLGEVTKEQLLALHFPGKSLKTIERALAPLVNHDPPLLQRRVRSETDPKTGITRRLPFVWSLTPDGHARVRGDDQYPLKVRFDQYPAKAPSPRVERVLEHDLLATDVMVALICRARSIDPQGRVGLSSVFTAREIRLHKDRPAPIMDALILIQMSTASCARSAVPWSKDPPLEDDRCWRFCIEADRGTEPLNVIAGKARNYRDCLEDDAWFVQWESRFGTFPHIIWIAPDERRLQAINATWHQEWPEGDWFLTTPEGLAENRFVRHTYQDEHYEINLLASSDLRYIGVRRQSLPSPTRPTPRGTPPVAQPAPLPAPVPQLPPALAPQAATSHSQIGGQSPRPKPQVASQPSTMPHPQRLTSAIEPPRSLSEREQQQVLAFQLRAILEGHEVRPVTEDELTQLMTQAETARVASISSPATTTIIEAPSSQPSLPRTAKPPYSVLSGSGQGVSFAAGDNIPAESFAEKLCAWLLTPAVIAVVAGQLVAHALTVWCRTPVGRAVIWLVPLVVCAWLAAQGWSFWQRPNCAASGHTILLYSEPHPYSSVRFEGQPADQRFWCYADLSTTPNGIVFRRVRVEGLTGRWYDLDGRHEGTSPQIEGWVQDATVQVRRWGAAPDDKP